MRYIPLRWISSYLSIRIEIERWVIASVFAKKEKQRKSFCFVSFHNHCESRHCVWACLCVITSFFHLTIYFLTISFFIFRVSHSIEIAVEQPRCRFHELKLLSLTFHLPHRAIHCRPSLNSGNVRRRRRWHTTNAISSSICISTVWQTTCFSEQQQKGTKTFGNLRFHFSSIYFQKRQKINCKSSVSFFKKENREIFRVR